MAVTLNSLCEKASYRYGMRIVAGRGGISNIVQWVHTVEDIEVGEFLHGGELIFSTGIANKNKNWLLPFVKNLIEKQVSGLVLNIGPYITEIPNDVINYCDKMDFPLLDIPWKSRIVDITRDFCNQIILDEKEEADVGQTLKNLVFFPGNAEQYIPVLECHNFDREAACCVLAVKTELNNNASSDKTDQIIERIICSFKKHWGGFMVDSVKYYVLCNFTSDELEQLSSNIQAKQYDSLYVSKIYIAVGPFNGRLETLSKNYQITSRLIFLAQSKNMSPIYYEKLGIKKLLLAVNDTEILKTYYKDNLSKLKRYDRENGTDYMSFLKMYLEYDGSVQRVAEETYVHRNTINYQLTKVKKILGSDLKTLEDRLNLFIAFQIESIL